MFARGARCRLSSRLRRSSCRNPSRRCTRRAARHQSPGRTMVYPSTCPPSNRERLDRWLSVFWSHAPPSPEGLLLAEARARISALRHLVTQGTDPHPLPVLCDRRKDLPTRCAELSTLGANRKARYACLLETGRGFFEAVCGPSDATAHLRDPPPTVPHTSRMVCSPAPPQGHPTAANLYSLLQYLVPNKKVQGGKCAVI